MTNHTHIRKKNNKYLSILGVALFCMATGFTTSSYGAGSIYEHDSFLERKAEGWFWYVDPKELEESEIIKPEIEIEPQIVQAEPENNTNENIKEIGPNIFSTAWLRDAMPKYLDLAIDEPTVENVQAYMYLQRLMMDKAERFAFSTQRVVSGDPMLDETVRRPLASFAIQGIDQKAGRKKSELIKSIAKDAGLFFFFSSNCQECSIQAPLIKNVMDNYGFAVLPISVDGENLPGSPFNEYKVDQGQAQFLDVQKLPALYLVTPNGQFELVGQSVYSLPELGDRILFAASRKGLITQDDLNETRPILDATNIADILDESGLAKDEANQKDLIKGVANSKELMKHINEALDRANY